MNGRLPQQTLRGDGLANPCPAWCVQAHGAQAGEEDLLHMSEPVYLSSSLSVRICMSMDPDTLETDGPHILINGEEVSPVDVRDIAERLSYLADLASLGASESV